MDQEINLSFQDFELDGQTGTLFIDVLGTKERDDLCAHNAAGVLQSYEAYSYDYEVLSVLFVEYQTLKETELENQNADFYIKDLFDQVCEELDNAV
jgi:hypothetical protein